MRHYRVSLISPKGYVSMHTHVQATSVAGAIEASGISIPEGCAVEIRPIPQDDVDEATIDAAYMSGF